MPKGDQKEKLKQKFSALDVSAQVSCLRKKLLGFRLNNVYDIAKKNYLFKFTQSGDKHLLLVDASSRIHTIENDVEKNTIPSGLTMKMRKNLRTRRLEKIEQ